jgi:hypothetical protein
MLTDFQKWWTSPFQAGMSVTGWFLFFGVIVVIAGMWKLIFIHIREA